MKRIGSILIIVIAMVLSSKDASAYGWRGWHRGYVRPYFAPPVPYGRPYYAPGPVYRGAFIRPHWRYTPYGREWIPGHWAR